MMEGEKRRFPDDAYTTVRRSEKHGAWLTVVAVKGRIVEAYLHIERADAFTMAIDGAEYHGLECLVRRAG
jgi:hypothetical protein